MSLLRFHRLLILVAIVFCGFYAGWELFGYLSPGRSGSLAIGLAALAAAALLGYYLLHLGRFVRLGDE